MSETTELAAGERSEPITLSEIRNKALSIRDQVKEEVSGQVADRRNQVVAAGVAAIVLFIGIAYFVGSRAGRRAADPRPY